MEEIKLNLVVEKVCDIKVTQRAQALIDLKEIFRKKSETNVDHILSDKAYHKVFESVFKAALIEKLALTKAAKTTRTSILKRLTICGEIVRLVVSTAGPTLKTKTLEAILNHIWQTLLEPDGGIYEHLAHYYLKSLSVLFEHQQVVETLKAELWIETVDFCLQSIDYCVDAIQGDSSRPTRTSSSLGTNNGRSPSMSRSTSGGGSSSNLILMRQNVEDLFQCLLSFVSAPNAPIHERYKEITGSTMHFLHLPGSTGGQVHHLAFSTLNAIMRFTRIDHSVFSQTIALEAIPEICRIWRGKSMTRDTMLNNLRSEILIFLLSSHLHLERCVREVKTDETLINIEELVDVLRTDYAKRSEEEMLLLDHLSMADFDGGSVRTSPFSLYPFHLMLHNPRGERDWAILQTIGVLERIVAIGHDVSGSKDEDHEFENRNRKRQRISRSFDRTLDPLKNVGEQTQTAGLQWVPFILEECQLAVSDLRELLEQLTRCAADKRANIASWALLALASCANQDSIRDVKPEELLQIWHLGAKALTFSTTCRAACLLLHALICKNLVSYQDIGSDVDSIIAAHDTNVVMVLCDSSITLMSHLLHVKVAETPGSISAFSQKVIRWLCVHWKPADREFSARYSAHVQPQQVTDLLRTCMGLSRTKLPTRTTVPFEAVAQAWQLHLNTQDTVRYLLLLPKSTSKAQLACSTCPQRSVSNKVVTLSTPSFYAARKLIIELTQPKCTEVLKNWKTLVTDRSGAVSTDTFRNGWYTCIAIALLMPHLKGVNSTQSSVMEEELSKLTMELLQFLDDTGTRDAKEAVKLNQTLLQSLEPYLPMCSVNELSQMSTSRVHLLKLIVAIADSLSKRRIIPSKLSTQVDVDDMDIDSELPREEDNNRHDRQKTTMPRRELALDAWSGTFYRVTIGRLALVTAISYTSGSAEYFPPSFIDYLLGLDIQETLSSRPFLKEILMSDLVLGNGAAHRLLVQMGGILSSDFGRSEVALQTCLDVLRCLWRTWTNPNSGDAADAAAEIYTYIIGVALGRKLASPDAQKDIAKLLLLLLHECQEYGVDLDLASPRSNLLNLLRKSNASVKFYIGSQISQIFALYLLKDHDDVFVDIQDVLPADPDWVEGISLRLYVFAKLASSWPNLLRRCIYHIFETAGRLPSSVEHSSCCLLDISADLKVESPRKLFTLFAPQILYTWLENEDIDDIPFSIFGFSSLQELIKNAQEEAVALMVMREQTQAVDKLASLLRIAKKELIQKSFTKVFAYSIAHAISTPRKSSPEKHVAGDVRVKSILGSDTFYECLHLHFADIIFVLFNVMDQEGDIERHFHKKELRDVAETLKKIKTFSSSDTKLPANQQPTFKAKFLTDEIEYLLRRTPSYDATKLYTDALVTSIARKLLGTIHPALGSLHACSVLRKLRVLIALAGKTAISGYPLEMLLQSIRPWITNTECADDAIGILQYLMDSGSVHLRQTPTFVAGLALSTMCSLRVFLESQRASTTQEIQHNSTMSKAQTLHAWTGKYMIDYNSPLMSERAKNRFTAIMESASNLNSVGNADNATPESQLLIQLLEDDKTAEGLLSEPASKLVMEMLNANFRSPASFRADALGADDMSASYAGVLWKSCQGSDNKQYLSWAARVLGRAFASTGLIHEELLRESTLFKSRDLSTSSSNQIEDPRTCIMRLLGDLTLGYDPYTTGLAEIVLRNILTTTNNSTLDDSVPVADPSCITNSLRNASIWDPYNIPPSESLDLSEAPGLTKDILSADAILQEHWLRDLAITVAQSVPSDILLGALVPILREVVGFANRSFPFILHLVLSTPAERQRINKEQLSEAFVEWFDDSESVDHNNLKMLLNCVLYLRTQPLAGEKSSADRAQWLDINYLAASVAATHCGMFKTSLLFVEEYCSQPAKSSAAKSLRRSSSIKNLVNNEVPTEILLRIYENVDDPDMYYGVQQSPSLKSILARFEYEKDGAKSLSFRGATYDSHIRRRDGESVKDVQSLVKALDVLNLDGLSHSLLQAQQTVGMTSESLQSMFHTARKLEQWDIPVPSTCTNNAVTIYKAYQTIDTAADRQSITQAIDEGLENTMRCLVREDLSASALHGSLQTLAALVEIDEVLSSNGSSDFEEMLGRFEDRSEWMKIGRFEDVTQILSCRGTTLSTLSQRPRLQQLLDLEPLDTRLVEVQTALLSSKINRAHSALQESLSLATAMIDLIVPCNEVGISPEVAIHVEAANALWDQGEMTSSIGMLQGLDDLSMLQKQTIKVGRSDLLSKIGYQVSVARLEKADRIIDKFLKPALKELKGNKSGVEAGHVFHQFAMFCDQQLQDPDSLEDLERLRRLRKNKADEVHEFDNLIKRAQGVNEKGKYKQMQLKAKTWLKLDDEELQRYSHNRDEFLRQCLENYLLALAASDDNDSNALRFAALWLEHSEEELANTAVSTGLKIVPSHKFAPLMNQLSSRLQNSDSAFQKLLFSLICRICSEHPFHGMYQIFAGVKSRINEKDESAVSRKAATEKVVGIFDNAKSKKTWTAVDRINRTYCALALERDDARYKAGKKIAISTSRAATALAVSFESYRVPPPTMPIALRPDMNYSKLPVMTQLGTEFTIAGGVSAPKIITISASNGRRFRQLVKGGSDDLRQDAIMEQVFEQVSELLKTNRSTRQRNLSIRTYKVLPLTNSAGLIEFVADTIPLHEYLMPAHERYYPKDLKGNQCRNEISSVSTKSIETRVLKFRTVTEKFHPVMRFFFTEKFTDPDEWFVKRLAYSRSTAAISILGHVLGLGDRHGHNILLDSKSGEVVHIDLGVAFEMGRVLPVPELVPFRLTRDIVDGMGITKTEGVFRRCCEFTLEALRKEVYSIMTILDVLRYDPLYSWSISPIRQARLQEGQSAALEADAGNINERGKESVNKPGEADRALTVVNKKLSKTLSVTATVNDLINQAVDERNLAVLYSGWAAYA